VADQALADQALAQHQRWLRRARIRYATAISTTLILIAAGVTFAIKNGEISTVRSKPAASAAPGLSVARAAPVLRLAWQSNDESAAASALVGGTVLTFSDTTVTGRDGRTGTPQWTYRRLHRRVCALAQISGRALIVLRDNGNCDELQALDAGTGRPVWDRSLDENAQPVNGDVTVATGSGTLFVYTAQVIYAIAVTSATCQYPSGPGCGSSDWVYSAAPGCRIGAMVTGVAGTLIGQHCASGDQLLLRDAAARIDWTIPGLGAAPVAADDSFIAAYDANTSTLRFDAATGHVLSSQALPGNAPAVAQLVGSTELVTVADHAYGISLNGTVRWRRMLTQLTVDGSIALAETGSAIAMINAGTGVATDTSALPALPSVPTRITPIGSGYLLQGSHTAAYQP
jgi:outer membrane protein assembly factor BamB